LPSVAFGARFAKTSRSAATPAPFLAELKHTGIRCPRAALFRRARCSCSGANLALLEVLLHQRFVHFHHLVDERGVRFLDGRKIGFAVGIEEAVHHVGAAFRGQVDRQAFPPDRLLDLARIAGRSAFSAVDTVDHDHAAQVPLRRPLEHAVGGELDPVSAFTTTTAVSTAASAPIACPMKSGDPGVSIRWMWTFFQAKLTKAELSECLYSFSSGSKSQIVLPFSTLPAEAIAPALASSASASVVFARAGVAHQRYSTNGFRRILGHADFPPG